MGECSPQRLRLEANDCGCRRDEWVTALSGVCYLTIWPYGVPQSWSVMPTWVTLRLPVIGQGLFLHTYGDSLGSSLLFVCLATREETRDRIPVIDERREWRWKEGLSGSWWSVSICLCFHGVNGFVGHSPSWSAEVLAVLHIGSVGAEGALIRVADRFEVKFAASCWNGTQWH